MGLRSSRHCERSEAIQSGLDCFVATLLAMTARKRMAPCGAIPVSALVFVAMFDDHDPVAMMPPTLMPAAVAMLAEFAMVAVFSTGAVAIMVTMPDDRGLSAGN